MQTVKGSLFVYFVKVIRANKTGAYDALLTDEDRQVLEGRILPSSWYPFETYKRCFCAVASVEAHNDPTVIRGWGRRFCDEIMLTIYKRMIIDTTPMQSLQRYVSMFSMFFNFGTLQLEAQGPQKAVLDIRDFDPEFQELHQLFFGWLERSLELTGARNVRTQFLTCSWLRAPSTKIELQWSE